jgi:hypothetical protein
LADSAAWTSWFSATAPPINEPGGSSARSRSIVRPTNGVRRGLLGNRGYQREAAARLRGHQRRHSRGIDRVRVHLSCS